MMASRELPNAGNGGRGDGQSLVKYLCVRCVRGDGRQL